MSAVHASGVVKRFESTTALDAVDIVVSEGEVRGLLGPNGAGKTTLLRVLFGLIDPDQGEVALFGRPRSDPAVLEGVGGFVEDPSFYPYLSGRANLELLADLDGTGEDAPIESVLDRAGLLRHAGERVSGYSTGMKQRLGIASSLLRSPRLLLLDEPTAGLDPAGARDAAALVAELARDGVAVVISSHQIGEVERICDSYTMLSGGRVVWEGTAAELAAQAPAPTYTIRCSDDDRAFELAKRQDGLDASRKPDGALELTADEEALDRYVLALAQAGIAVRLLELTASPLESMFFAVTE